MKKGYWMLWMLTWMTMLLCIPACAEATPVTSGIDLTPAINAAIALIAAIFTIKVIPYMREKMSDAQYQRVQAMINVAVYAAEEIYRSGHGDEKLGFVKGYLREKGYDIDVEQIKAAVKRMRDAEGAASA